MQSEKPICANCLLSFANKSSLKRHIRSAHPPKVQVNSNFFSNHQIPFECSECHKKFSRKDNLIRHQHLCLPDQVQLLFECDHCKTKFNRKSSLADHLQTRCCHKVCSTIKCVVCRSHFPSVKVLNEHYKLFHRVQFLYKKIRFKCFKEFQEWKNKLEQKTICRFRIRRRRQNETEVKLQYICHRSGIYNRSEATGKRFRRLRGSKRVGGHCPAEIKVSCSQVNHSCVVSFQNVHVGHKIGKKVLTRTCVSKQGGENETCT